MPFTGIKLIVLSTETSGIFHIGFATDYEKKVEVYQKKTGAYIKLASDPLWIVFDKVVHVLNNLRLRKHIQSWQLYKTKPKREHFALGYLYVIPKPHKVVFNFSFILLLCVLFVVTGRNTIKTSCLINEYINNYNFQVFR
jgi:hypothetical protein